MIEKYKNAVEQCLEILDQEIDKALSDDKLHSALKGKKMAAEDAKFYAKEIDVLEAELNEEEAVKEPTKTGVERYAED